MDYLIISLQAGATIIVLALVARFANSRLVKHFEGKPHLAFRRQLIQLAGVLAIILALVLFLPLDGELRGQLLSLYGLVVSATIALSSTTLVGNVMASIMLKTIKSCRAGYYITVGDHFGRITTMDLLHTEIQTEERDLTTLRTRTMDALHASDIEIVSPNFMNTRSLDSNERFIPDVEAVEEPVDKGASTDAPVFDKAEEAESVTKLRERLEAAQERIKVCRAAADDKGNPDATSAATAEIESLEQKIARLAALIDKKEAKISEAKTLVITADRRCARQADWPPARRPLAPW